VNEPTPKGERTPGKGHGSVATYLAGLRDHPDLGFVLGGRDQHRVATRRADPAGGAGHRPDGRGVLLPSPAARAIPTISWRWSSASSSPVVFGSILIMANLDANMVPMDNS
jgi:hypothetical protein